MQLTTAFTSKEWLKGATGESTYFNSKKCYSNFNLLSNCHLQVRLLLLVI